jgi:outer membrane protein assembly factor BamB
MRWARACAPISPVFLQGESSMDRDRLSILAAYAFAILALSAAPAAAVSGWPQFGYDAGHTGYNPKETVISSGNVASLAEVGTLTTSGQISDPVMVANGVAYVNSNYSNTLYAYNVASGQLLWSFIGTNLDAPTGIAVSGGTVFVTCAIDSSHAGLCALKARTGKLLWSWAYTGFTSLPDSPPAVSGDTVYFVEYETYGDWLTALDVKTGTVLWQFGYCADTGICVAMGQNAPAIDGGMVYVGCAGESGLAVGVQGICAVSATTGQEAWTMQLGGNGSDQWGDGSGRLIANKGVVYANYETATCYNCNYTIDVVALNETTGATIWDTPVSPTLNNNYGPDGPPALHGKQVFAVLDCCDADDDSGLVALTAKTGQLQWYAETSNWLESSPSLVTDLALVECGRGNAGTICAFDTSDGSLLWNSPDSGAEGGITPIITGGIAYEVCGSNNVCLYAPQ